MGTADDATVESLIEAGAFAEAAELAMRRHGAELMGYLVGVMGDQAAASEVFSRFTEDMWRGLPGFKGSSSFRTWAYCVARNARAKYYRDPFRRRGRRLMTAELSRIAEQVVTGVATRAERADRVQRLRAQLTPEERELLTLRIDRDMDWADVAEVVGEKPATVRKRFERLRKRVRELMRAQPS